MSRRLSLGGKRRVPPAHGLLLFLAVSLGGLFCAGMVPVVNGAETPEVPVKVIEVINRDAGGVPIGFPSQVFFDPTMAETYVIARGKINVYGPDFYPVVTLGAGRGATAPQGIFVDRDGMVYLCQSGRGGKPARLSIFNAAFFLTREIVFTGFEGAEKYSPHRVAVSQDGRIYLASDNTRGVVVLDREGKFLHWLRPEDRVYAREAIEEAIRTQGKEEAVGGESEDLPKEGLHADIPAELLPKTKKEKEEVERYGVAPVQISDIEIDTEGHFYLLSAETSKVYVYSPSEEFLFSFGQKGGAPGKMSQPKGLAVDEKKKSVYIADYMRHTVLIYDLAGKFMEEFGGLGTAPGWFYFPTDVALDKNDYLLVADLFNKRVQVLDVQFKQRFPMFGAPTRTPSADRDEVLPAISRPAAGGAVEALVPAGEKKEEPTAVEAPTPDTEPLSADGFGESPPEPRPDQEGIVEEPLLPPGMETGPAAAPR